MRARDLDGVALNLHGFYAGVERIFEEIAREIDGSLPAGPEWHRDLLLQMSAEVAGTRPPVIAWMNIEDFATWSEMFTALTCAHHGCRN